jgi:hypothetical protein
MAAMMRTTRVRASQIQPRLLLEEEAAGVGAWLLMRRPG